MSRSGERHRVLVGGEQLTLMGHAIERYVERVKPSFSYGQGVVELVRLLAGCEVVMRAPAWAGRRDDGGERWVLLSEGIALPVVSGVLVTCITRAEVGAELRVLRAAERRAKRAAKGAPGARKPHGKLRRQEGARAREKRSSERADW